LVELENNATATLNNLVDGMNKALGANHYDFVDTGIIGSDAIKVGFIYKPAHISPIGNMAVLDSRVDPRFIDTKNRPALVQTFAQRSNNERLTLAIAHFKSKGSACDDVGDPNRNDGQGNCNQTRTAAANALVDFLATDPTHSGDPDRLILGDLNAYAMEDPIQTITAAGYVDLIRDRMGTDAYSFVFSEQFGYLDHALANATLNDQVTAVTEWHINADEPCMIDYNEEFKSPAQIISLYEPSPYRSSDHDPVIIKLQLNGSHNKNRCTRNTPPRLNCKLALCIGL